MIGITCSEQSNDSRRPPCLDPLNSSRISPQSTPPHEAAALLLVMLGELPRPLLPATAVTLIDAAWEAGQLPESAQLPDSLLQDLLSPAELVSLKGIARLLHKVWTGQGKCCLLSPPHLCVSCRHLV